MRRMPITLLLLLPMTAGSLGAPLALGRRYDDETTGYRIQIPKKWEQVPTKFNEVALVAKWGGRARRGQVQTELHVYRFQKAAGETAADEPEPAPDDAGPRGIPGYRRLQDQPKSFWEMIENRFGFAFAEDPQAPAAELKMKDKSLRGELRVFTRKGGLGLAAGRDGKMEPVLFCAAIERREEPDAQFGVLYATSVADLRDMRRVFQLSIRRFRILDPDEEEADEEAGPEPDIFVDSETKPTEWREARKRKLAGLRDWDALDTANYLIVYNKKVKRPLLKKIAKHIEAIRAQVYEKLFPPSRDVKAISVVRVCKDIQEYHRYGGPGGSAGYWSRGDEDLVVG
ncbi:MAG: hypothetical protein ACE5JG_02830, partial [Planctomycetota bacterium]